jgi:hypothetical protein
MLAQPRGSDRAVQWLAESRYVDASLVESGSQIGASERRLGSFCVCRRAVPSGSPLTRTAAQCLLATLMDIPCFAFAALMAGTLWRLPSLVQRLRRLRVRCPSRLRPLDGLRRARGN